MQRLSQGAYFVSSPWSGSFEGPDGVFFCSVYKERRGCLVEWVEKASFAQLNKLFKIDVVEWVDSVLFSDKKLLALIKYPKPFIILVSVIRLFTQKKKTVARHVQRVRILPLASPSSSSASSFSSPSSLSYNDEPKAGVDWPVPSIICENEEDEEKMASDLRVGFCERQHKHPLSKLTLPTITTIVTLGLDEKPSFVEDISYHEIRKPFIISGKISEDSFECLNFSPLHTKVDENPNQSFMSRLPYGTPDTAITHIIYLKDYTTFKTMEVLEFVTLCGNESTFSNDWKQLEP
ncbi:hypothetical protein AAG906_017948 [Vitis piasezkii]